MKRLTADDVVVTIPLGWRTKNHLRSMYFGALAIGADLAAGAICLHRIQDSGQNISFVFKDVQASFLRRPTGDVDFSCTQGQAIAHLVAKAIDSGEREDLPVHVSATVPSESDDPVATFVLTLSIKHRP